MCGRKSKTGLKTIVALSVLFVLLASPCCAASPWRAFFPKKGSAPVAESQKATSSEETPTEPTLEVKEASSQETSTPSSETPSENSSMVSEEPSTSYEEEFTSYLNEVTNYVAEVENLEILSEKLQNQLDAYAQTEKISEAEYESVKTSLVSTVKANEEQAEYIAELEKEAGTKVTTLLGPILGFKGMKPIWGIGGTLNVKWGKNWVTSFGADYMLGDFESLKIPTLDLDNLTMRFQFGYQW